jgi:hypothetical protein
MVILGNAGQKGPCGWGVGGVVGVCWAVSCSLWTKRFGVCVCGDCCYLNWALLPMAGPATVLLIRVFFAAPAEEENTWGGPGRQVSAKVCITTGPAANNWAFSQKSFASSEVDNK